MLIIDPTLPLCVTERAQSSSARVARLRALGMSLLLGCLAFGHAQAVVVPVDNAVQAAVGDDFGCLLNTEQQVLCWGSNSRGQLGREDVTESALPIAVPGLPAGITQIDSGEQHSCAIDSARDLWCWGSNVAGELGLGDQLERFAPERVASLGFAVAQISLGAYSSCARSTAGALSCWGANTAGQLGDGTLVSRSLPTPVQGLTRPVTHLASGAGHRCAITDLDSLLCWGGNASGQLGNGTLTQASLPTPVPAMASGVGAVAGGFNHTCATRDDGTAWCWGSGVSGQLGNGSTTSQQTLPVQVTGLVGASALSLGAFTSCALADVSNAPAGAGSGGTPFCWGSNGGGQLGDLTFIGRSTPVAVQVMGDAISMHAGKGSTTCAVLSGGRLSCWGTMPHGDGGTGSSLLPALVPAAGSAGRELALGDRHSCLRLDSGEVRCWGGNQDGEVGDGSQFQRLQPVPVALDNRDALAIDAGGRSSCAIIEAPDPNRLAPSGNIAGALRCWGDNSLSKLGDGSETDRPSPIPIEIPGAGVLSIDVGPLHSCIGDGDGLRHCAGRNTSGEACAVAGGVRSTFESCSGNLPSVVEVATGGAHACALTLSGNVACWGNGTVGQLGNGGTLNSDLPQAVLGLPANIRQVVAGSDFSCARAMAGSVWCWGGNAFGQLGDDTQIQRNSAVAVVGLPANVVEIAGGGSHACARSAAGVVHCWGLNTQGQLGDGTQINRLAAVPVSGLGSGTAHIAVGPTHTCALAAAGAVRCWGSNIYGELGLGIAALRAVPGPVLVDSIFMLQATPATLAFGTTSQLSATGGGSGAISFAVTAGAAACAISDVEPSAATLTATAVGSCEVTAIRAPVDGIPMQSATVMLSVIRAEQGALSINAVPSQIRVGQSSTLAVSGGSGTGGISASVTAGASFCQLSGTSVTALAVGSCTVTVTRAGDANYLPASASVVVTVIEGNAGPLVFRDGFEAAAP